MLNEKNLSFVLCDRRGSACWFHHSEHLCLPTKLDRPHISDLLISSSNATGFHLLWERRPALLLKEQEETRGEEEDRPVLPKLSSLRTQSTALHY